MRIPWANSIHRGLNQTQSITLYVAEDRAESVPDRVVAFLKDIFSTLKAVREELQVDLSRTNMRVGPANITAGMLLRRDPERSEVAGFPAAEKLRQLQLRVYSHGWRRTKWLFDKGCGTTSSLWESMRSSNDSIMDSLNLKEGEDEFLKQIAEFMPKLHKLFGTDHNGEAEEDCASLRAYLVLLHLHSFHHLEECVSDNTSKTSLFARLSAYLTERDRKCFRRLVRCSMLQC